jgi:hypothetical protein
VVTAKIPIDYESFARLPLRRRKKFMEVAKQYFDKLEETKKSNT